MLVYEIEMRGRALSVELPSNFKTRTMNNVWCHYLIPSEKEFMLIEFHEVHDSWCIIGWKHTLIKTHASITAPGMFIGAVVL